MKTEKEVKAMRDLFQNEVEKILGGRDIVVERYTTHDGEVKVSIYKFGKGLIGGVYVNTDNDMVIKLINPIITANINVNSMVDVYDAVELVKRYMEDE